MFLSACLRGLALLIWAPAVYLSYYIVREFTEGQSFVIVGIALIALLVSSVSLLHGRASWRRDDKVSAYASYAMYGLGVAVFLFFEMGFWNSSVMTSHAGAQRAAAAIEGADLLAQKDRDALRSGVLAESSAEVKARMDAQLAQPIGNQPLSKLTSNCEDRQSAAFRLCGEYLAMKAQHAKALASEKMQERVWNIATKVEPAGLKRDLFAGANTVAGISGIGTPEGWAMAFSALMVLLLTVTRDLSLVIAFAPRQQATHKPAEAVAAEPKAEPAPEPLPEPLPAPEAVATALKQKPRPLDRPLPPTPPSPPGQRMSETAVKEIRERLSDNVVVDLKPRAELPAFASDVFEESAPPAAKRAPAPRREDRRHRLQGRAGHWLSECTDRTHDLSVTLDYADAWDSYQAWCIEEDLKPLGKAKFLRAISASIGTAPGQKAFIGLVLTGVEVEKIRAVA
jgi:hypothetical protein